MPPIPSSSAPSEAAVELTQLQRPAAPSNFVFNEGEDSLAASRVELERVAAADDDIAESPAAASALQPPIAEHHRMAPPLGYADRVYKQSGAGRFERVAGVGLSSGATTGGRADGCGRDVVEAPSSSMPSTSRSGTFLGALGGGGHDDGPSLRLPMPFELQLASALCLTIAAPTRFVAALMAGAAILEALLLGSLDDLGDLRAQPLSPLLLYAPAALSFYQLALWGSLATFVGVTCAMLVRERGSHYSWHPWRKTLDRTLQVLYFTNMWLTYAGRQMPYTLASLHQKELTPHFGPTITSDFANLQKLWDAHIPELIARQVITILAALLTFVPTCDECFTRPPPSAGGRAAVRPSEAGYGGGGRGAAAGSYGYLHGGGGTLNLNEHVLGLASMVEGGLTLGIGFWSQRMEIELTHPEERAPDGSSALRPLSHHALNRKNYASRVLWTVFFLVLDAVTNLFTDAVHFEDSQVELFFMVAMAVVPALLRVLTFVPFVLLLTGTTHFQLGLYAVLQKDFGGALGWGGVSFAGSASVHALGVVRAALGHSRGENALEFHTSGWGVVYSILFVAHMLLTATFYIKTIMALKRLANSEYYLHPQSTQAANAPSQRASQVYHGMVPRL